MKIAVYTIALNEEKFVERWFNSVREEADLVLIADTGSTDRTVEIAKSLGIEVHSIAVRPWRFDVARNVSLALIPEDVDYCIQLDMDEVLRPGWRAELELALAAGATRPRYEYIWSWNSDGTPAYEFSGSKIHSRFGYVWKHAIHELPTADRIQEVYFETKIVMEHHPDSTKSRSQYLPLLELDAKENPHDDRSAFYLAREYYFQGRPAESIVEFKRYLALASSWWPPERATAMRFLAKLEPESTEVWLRLAIDQAPGRREALVDLANHFHLQQMWQESLLFAELALAITEKPLDYACEADPWGFLPYDLAAIANHNLQEPTKALRYGSKALELATPEHAERLENNLAFYVS